MPKPTKRKVLNVDDFGNFSVTTTVFGHKQVTLKGYPTVVIRNKEIQIGCMLFSKKAIKKITEIMNTSYSFYQKGNY